MGPHKETGSFSMSLVTINYISSSVISQFVIKFYALKSVINLDWCQTMVSDIYPSIPCGFCLIQFIMEAQADLFTLYRHFQKFHSIRPADLYYFYMNFFAMSLVHKLAITRYVSRITIQNLICANMFCNFMNQYSPGLISIDSHAGLSLVLQDGVCRSDEGIIFILLLILNLLFSFFLFQKS